MSLLSKPAIGLETKLFYGAGSIAYGAKSNGLNYFLLIYYNQVLGLPVLWVGLILMVALLVDAISDPLMGYVSDNFHSSLGRRHPFMYMAALPAALLYFFLWNPPSFDEKVSLFWWALAFTIGVRLVATMYETPSTALAPDLTSDYHKRTELLSYRYAFGWAGGASMAIISYLFLLRPTETIPTGQLNPEGYHVMGLIGALVIFSAILLSAFGTHKYIPYLNQPPPKRNFGIRRVFKELYETCSNHSFLVIFLSALFISIANGISINMTLYMMTYFWEFPAHQLGFLTFGNLLSALLALAFAPMISRQIGKKRAAILTSSLAFFILPLPVLLRFLGLFPDNDAPYFFFVYLGFFIIDIMLIIAASILTASMVADLAEDSELQTQRRSEGVFFASITFIQKALVGVGALISALLLSFIAFPQNAQPGAVSDDIIFSLGLVYMIGLWVFYSLGILCLTQYRIDETKHKQNLALLKRAR